MDDYNSNVLNDSKSEWSIRLMNILSGHIIDGFRSIFSEAMEVCEKNDEAEKYLMTFQNYLSIIPKWNQNMVDTEVERIKTSSQCKYLEDLITCVHILQLKLLSCVRTGNQNKKIDIDIPCFKKFLHNVYINIARKLYSNIYLFQIDVTPLQQQKHNREFEVIVQTCILNTIRDNIPVEQLLKQYIDETQEVDVEKTEKIVEEEKPSESVTESSGTDAPTGGSYEDNVSSTNITFKETPDMDIPPPSSHASDSENNSDDQDKSIDLTNVTSDSNEENMGLNPRGGSITDDEVDSELHNSNKLRIGDDVPLILDDEFDKKSSTGIEEIHLDFDEINDENKITGIGGGEPPIDLGIEELAI
tara:strand:+ start:4196 stop:5272 length:1077 start_codon:yes stop_codon:yes gene_type:complete